MAGRHTTLCSRRALLSGGLAIAAAPRFKSAVAAGDQPLGARAAAKGLQFGASFSTNELDTAYGSQYAAMYRREASVLTSELEFKMGIVKPDAGITDLAPADRLVDFAIDNGLTVRGHTLIWNDYLPDWIHALPHADVARLLDTHVAEIMTRYRGRVKSWDVVNEPIAPWDRLQGNLRKGPYLSAMGEDYIARSFRLARAADPDAELVLNEAQTESADENGQTFRDSFLALVKRLKAADAPIDGIGLQCHLDTGRPYDFPRFAGFVEDIAALGYRILLTELDVNDRALPRDVTERDKRVARMYGDFLKTVLPIKAVTTLTLWQMADHTSWLYYDAVSKSPDSPRRPRPLIYDQDFARKRAWYAVAEALDAMPPR